MITGNNVNRPNRRSFTPVLIGSTTYIDHRTKKRWWSIKWMFVGVVAVTFLFYTYIMVFVDFKATTIATGEYTTNLEQKMRRNFDQLSNEDDNDDTYMNKLGNNGSGRPDNNSVGTDSVVNCLTDDCIKQIASTMARAFPIRKNKSSWCTSMDDQLEGGVPVEGNSPKESGIILIKVTKAASSTSAGVAIRIATRHSCSNLQWRHRFANEVHYQSQRSFLLTTIREPASRAVSTVFFHTLSRQQAGLGFKVTDDIVLNQLQTSIHNHSGAISAGQGGFQLRYLYPHGTIPEYSAWIPDQPNQVINTDEIIERVRRTINTYDFVIIPERMDESLVVLALLLQIDVGDVLVTSSKVAGTSQYHLLHPSKTTYRCLSTFKSFITPTVSNFLQSNHWRAMNYGDYILYEIAQQSLDRTIRDTIGKERFEIALQRYRTLQQLEQKYCAPHVQFPCSNDGTPQLKVAHENCYLFYYDFGCGYPCIDDIIQQYDRRTLTTREINATISNAF